MNKRVALIGLVVVALAAPAAARLWKPTPLQLAQDYATITHNKGVDGRVVVAWAAPPIMTGPALEQLLDKYVVISIVHTRQAPGGGVSWDDVEGVQVSDSDGKPLTQVSPDAEPPTLVGMVATMEALMKQGSQGKAKPWVGVYEAGTVNACTKGRLSVAYEGETYTFDTPMPGCAK